MKKSTLATTLLTLGVFFWGWSFVFVKESVDRIDVFSFIMMRFLLAAVVMAFVANKRFLKINREVVGKGIVAGAVLSFSFIAQTIGIQITSASNAAFITGLTVIVVPIIVTFLDRKPPKASKIAAIIIAFVGLGLLTLKNGLHIGSGDIWLLFCAVGFATHLVMMNRFIGGVDSLVFTTIQLFTISVVSGITGFCINGALQPPDGIVVWRAVFFCGVFASAFIYTVQSHYQKHISEIKTAIIFALEPLFAAFAAWIYLSEILTARAMTGGAMIIIGAILVDVEFSRRKDVKEKSE